MAVFLQVITLFLLIFCGFFSAKGKLVDENGISTLNKIVLYFALPALTLYGLQKDASPELIHDLILVFFISLAIMILSGLIAYFLYRSEPNERRSVLTNLSMLSNSAYMGYPVVIATLGEDMLIYAVVFVGAFNLMCWTFGSFFFGGISAIQPKKLLTNPSLIAVIVGLVLFLTGWRLPGFINDALSMMGNVTTPLAMFVIGARLIDLRFAHLQDWKLLLACALRLIIFPAAVLLLRFTGLPAAVVSVLYICTAMPCAATTAMQSRDVPLRQFAGFARGGAVNSILDFDAAADAAAGISRDFAPAGARRGSDYPSTLRFPLPSLIVSEAVLMMSPPTKEVSAMRKSWLFPGDNDEPYVSQRAGAYQPQSEKRRRWTKRLVILALILCVLYPFVEPYTLRTTQTAITCEDLPASIGQLRIVYVSDIHYGTQMFSDARLSSLINRINALNADIVLLGGDYARDKWSAAAFFENLPRRISSNYGVYAVVGECDRSPLEKDEEPSTLRNKMSKAGVTLLCNEVATLRIGTSDIYIAGIDDVSTEMDDAKSVAAQVNSKDFVIFLAHNPSVISSSLLLTDRNGRGNWFDLGLFGHTHGGQIPFLEEAFNFNGVPSRYESGLLLENRSWLLISRGVGTTGLPARLFCQPEIHLITVQSGT